eukprot:3536489-Prymnesium_polylepis.1
MDHPHLGLGAAGSRLNGPLYPAHKIRMTTSACRFSTQVQAPTAADGRGSGRYVAAPRGPMPYAATPTRRCE